MTSPNANFGPRRAARSAGGGGPPLAGTRREDPLCPPPPADRRCHLRQLSGAFSRPMPSTIMFAFHAQQADRSVLIVIIRALKEIQFSVAERRRPPRRSQIIGANCRRRAAFRAPEASQSCPRTIRLKYCESVLWRRYGRAARSRRAGLADGRSAEECERRWADG